MQRFYDRQLQQWQRLVGDGRCDLLNRSGIEGFAIIACGGRVSQSTIFKFAADSDQVVFCLNAEGNGELGAAQTAAFRASHLIFLHQTAGSELSLCRFAGNHQFILLSLATDYLEKLLHTQSENVTSPISSALRREGSAMITEPMSIADKAFSQALTSPPVVSAASHLWFHGKVMEFIATHCYEEPGKKIGGFFCSQQKRLAQDRIAKAIAYLREHLDEPLKLESVARSAGTSPHYLSRTFSNETGRTLSRYLRKLRVERATELLRSGRMNVSEAAIEVGYQSQSHFSRAFETEMGCTPSKFLADGETLIR